MLSGFLGPVDEKKHVGTIRIRERGSANGHNGVKSISGALGTEEWLRIRIGVGKPLPEAAWREMRAGGKDFLLSPGVALMCSTWPLK